MCFLFKAVKKLLSFSLDAVILLVTDKNMSVDNVMMVTDAS